MISFPFSKAKYDDNNLNEAASDLASRLRSALDLNIEGNATLANLRESLETISNEFPTSDEDAQVLMDIYTDIFIYVIHVCAILTTRAVVISFAIFDALSNTVLRFSDSVSLSRDIILSFQLCSDLT